MSECADRSEESAVDGDRARSDAGSERARWGAGIVNHGSYDELDRCLESLARQSLPPEAIAVYDTGEDPARFEAERAAHPGLLFESGPNRGYAGGANRVVDRLASEATALDYILVLNPDVELDPDFSVRLIEGIDCRPRVAIATGKLLRPDRRTLDTAGIRFPRHGRPRDRGSDVLDRGQFDAREFVDAASGAAMMLRVSTLDDLALEGELFDESFFAYHEDTDLCWRARRFGWQILYEPRAVGVHVRGWRRSRRAEIAISTRRHSFKNHYLQLVKNETLGHGLRNLPWLLGWEILRFGFVVLRDRPMLGAYAEAWRALPEARRKRTLVQSRARRSGRFREIARVPDKE
jgi:GT2 family glycosyltransferase